MFHYVMYDSLIGEYTDRGVSALLKGVVASKTDETVRAAAKAALDDFRRAHCQWEAIEAQAAALKALLGLPRGLRAKVPAGAVGAHARALRLPRLAGGPHRSNVDIKIRRLKPRERPRLRQVLRDARDVLRPL